MTRWYAVGVLALTACGGGPAPPPEYTERSSAQKQCDALMEIWCESALDCVQSALEPEAMLSETELAEQRSLCIEVAKQSCDAADGVGARYDECRADVEVLEAADCEAVRTAVRDDMGEAEVPMPESCSELFVGGD
jgi:hypothetical protein